MTFAATLNRGRKNDNSNYNSNYNSFRVGLLCSGKKSGSADRENDGGRKMEQRLIDGNELFGIVSLLNADIVKANPVARWLIQIVLHDIGAMPTIKPDDLQVVKRLREKLAKVTAEKNAAINDMEALMWYGGDGCNICQHCVEVHRKPYVRLACELGNRSHCDPKWLGLREEDK